MKPYLTADPPAHGLICNAVRDGDLAINAPACRASSTKRIRGAMAAAEVRRAYWLQREHKPAAPDERRG